MRTDKKEILTQEVKQLVDRGHLLLLSEIIKHMKETGKEKDLPKLKDQFKDIDLRKGCQKWYTLCLPVIEQILPERAQEFKDCYSLDKRKEILLNTYTIRDYLMGLVLKRYDKPLFDPFAAFHDRFQTQIQILESAIDRLDSSLRDIAGVLQAELLDDERLAADDLLKKGHLRAAGALVGVTLEAHLGKILHNHGIVLKKKNPSIGDYNDFLKDHEIIELPMWRFMQRLGDIRNLCTHRKEKDPKKDDVEDLLRGVRKVIAEVF